jgi:energy-coupling factor transporter ATP-binding protein EcfA2
MNVVGDLQTWLEDQPIWLTEALNRLLSKSNLDDQDIEDLTELCKKVHGLSDKEIIITGGINDDKDSSNQGPVKIVSIHHIEGVNALAENQKLEFGPNLTVVYGDNGAGKSGYTRILKQACNARGTEEILGNVFDGSMITKPKVIIEYSIGEISGTVENWEEEESPLHMVNVFDSHSASVYLNEKTDVAFRPFGLDLYDKLSSTSERVRKKLEAERSLLESSVFIPPVLPSNTKATEFLSRLNAKTTQKEFDEKIKITPEDKARLSTIEKMIDDSKKADKTKLKLQLEARKRRIEGLMLHLLKVNDTLNDTSLTSLLDLKKRTEGAKNEVDKLRRSKLDTSLLPGTGSEIWRPLWEAAKSFSEKSAYPDTEFPRISSDAKCVLCQQEISEHAKKRFELFSELVQSVAEKDYSVLNKEFSEALNGINELNVIDSETERLLEDLKIESLELSKVLEGELNSVSKRKEIILDSIKENRSIDQESLPKFKIFEKELEEQANGLAQRISNLDIHQSQIPPEIIQEKNELMAKHILTPYESFILKEIERKMNLALYESCLKDVRTNNITRKSSAVTKEIVSQKLKESFLAELNNMAFDHVEVELIEAGGERGAMYHKLVLTRAPNIEVPKIASEGESRCLSIAAFFAELSTADDPSAILFDDPVSSLDHKWRTRIARRLVNESKDRQVIVFTHDLVFLLELHSNAEESSLPIGSMHLRRERAGAGIVIPDLPWKAMKVKSRIGVLNNDLQEARKQYNMGNFTLYDSMAHMIYGNLRETWERALEEVLLNGTVQRYRRNIQTLQLSKLADITEDDCKIFEKGMTKSSKWLIGHDLARAENEDIPKPDELEEDINGLKNWVENIRKRR